MDTAFKEVAQFPLLREGSYLMRAPSTLRFDPASGTWLIILRDDLETEADREVTALPSEALEDMITHIRGRTKVQWFEVTALVLTYRKRNFLLPLVAIPLSDEPPRQPRAARLPPGAVERAAMVAGPNRLSPLFGAGVTPSASGATAAAGASGPASAAGAPRVRGPRATTIDPTARALSLRPGYAPPRPAMVTNPAVRPPGTVAPKAPSSASPISATTATPSADTTAPPPSVDPEQFADDIERALEERIRIVPRSSDVGPASSSSSRPRSASDPMDVPAMVTLPTSVRIQDRRGVVTRDPISGTWRFVFHGERADVGERGVELLPSTVLERMERFVRQSETPPILLVSGQLTKFEGRNFLLPSSFRSIASGRWIFP